MSLLLWMMACSHGDHTAHGDHAHTDGHGDSGEVVGEVQGTLISPAEATDLDPDPAVLRVRLQAAPATHTFVDWRDGSALEVEGYAYNGQSPGPTLRARVGDTIEVELENGLDEETTLHWHGLHIPYDQDGVTWTHAGVAPGESAVYRFTVDRAGTFWYHPHFDVKYQVDRGLYGALIVEDPAEPAMDGEQVAILDDWTAAASTAVSPDDDHVHGAHGGEGLWTVNGQVLPRLEVAGGERHRLRLINASNSGYLWLEWPGQRRIAGDQGRLEAPDEAAGLLLAPGDRAEAELLPGAEGFSLIDRPYAFQGGEAHGETEARLDVALTAPGAAASPTAFAWGGAAPTPDPGFTDVLYTLQGELHTDAWMINGEVFPDITVQSLVLGRFGIVEVRNLSATEHPFHLHGMAFEVLSVDGVPPVYRQMEDTINVDTHQVVRLGVWADNPGDWMAHCHILPHEHEGMMTVLRVE